MDQGRWKVWRTEAQNIETIEKKLEEAIILAGLVHKAEVVSISCGILEYHTALQVQLASVSR